MKLLKMAGKWKLGVAALAILGLSVLPATFNVPGVGVVQAFAGTEKDEGNLEGAEVVVGTNSKAPYDGVAHAANTLTITSITFGDDDDTVDNAGTIFELASADGKTIKDADTYTLKLEVKDGQDAAAAKFNNWEAVRATYTVEPRDITTGTGAANWKGGNAPVVTFNGKEQTPDFKLVSGNIDLTAADYKLTVEEGAIKKAGKYTLTVTGQGNYKGVKQLELNVGKATITDDDITVSPATASYTGGLLEPTVSVSIGGTEVSSDDYTATWSGTLRDAGDYDLTIAGDNIDNITKSGAFKIGGTSIAGADVSGYAKKVWKGETLGDDDKKAVVVKVDGKKLVYGTDYTVNFDNTANKGTYYITIEGKVGSNYSGEKKVPFTVVEKNLTTYGTLDIDTSSIAYDGTDTKLKKTAKVTLSGTDLETLTLEAETEYSIDYENADDTKGTSDVGTITVTVTGLTPIKGSLTASYTVTAADLSKGKIVDNTAKDYNYGLPVVPDAGDVTVYDSNGDTVANTNYTLSYENNKDAGKATIIATGKGNYTGTLKGEFTINPKAWDNLNVTGYEKKVAYTGSQIKPSGLTVVDGVGHQTLVEGKDYELSYGGNVDIGVGTFTIKALGNYAADGSDPVTKDFEIVAADLSSEKVATITAAAQTYTGKELTPVVVTQTLSDGTKKTLTAGTDYEVTYESNINAGTAKYTITGKDTAGYTGTKSGEFTINKAVTKAKITKLASKNGKKTVAPKKKLQLVATQTPTKADANHTLKNTITWTSSSKKIATVDKNGKVTGVKAGVATITAKSADGTKKTFKVTVVGVTSKTTQSVKAGKSVKIKANDTIKKATATSGKAYVKVSKSGKTVTIKGVKAGKAKVTITTKNGGKDVITVTVK